MFINAVREATSLEDLLGKSSDERPLNVAVLGCGYWGVNYVRVLDELPQTNVAVICDQRPQRLAEMRRRFHDVETTTEMADVLRRPDVDAVVLCTPATTHYEIARACLQQGKHMLIEKPITTTAVEAKKLRDYAASQRLVLMVGHTFLYNSAVRKMKEYVEESGPSNVYYLYARRTNLGPIRHDVNALWDLAPHDISIFNYLLGTKTAVGQRHGQQGVAQLPRRRRLYFAGLRRQHGRPHPRQLGRSQQGARGGRSQQRTAHRLRRSQRDGAGARLREGD